MHSYDQELNKPIKKNCENLILNYLNFKEIKHDDQIGYEEVRAIYLLLLEQNRSHFAEHDIEMLMATVLQRYSIESVGHMSELGKLTDYKSIKSPLNHDSRTKRVVILYWEVSERFSIQKGFTDRRRNKTGLEREKFNGENIWKHVRDFA